VKKKRILSGEKERALSQWLGKKKNRFPDPETHTAVLKAAYQQTTHERAASSEGLYRPGRGKELRSQKLAKAKKRRKLLQSEKGHGNLRGNFAHCGQKWLARELFDCRRIAKGGRGDWWNAEKTARDYANQ